MTKKTKSTTQVFIESISAKERKQRTEEFMELVLPELIMIVEERKNMPEKKKAKLEKIINKLQSKKAQSGAPDRN